MVPPTENIKKENFGVCVMCLLYLVTVYVIGSNKVYLNLNLNIYLFYWTCKLVLFSGATMNIILFNKKHTLVELNTTDDSKQMNNKSRWSGNANEIGSSSDIQPSIIELSIYYKNRQPAPKLPLSIHYSMYTTRHLVPNISHWYRGRSVFPVHNPTWHNDVMAWKYFPH